MNQQNMSEANDRARRQRRVRPAGRCTSSCWPGRSLAVAFIFFTGRWILRPIHRLIRSADEIRRGNLDLVVPADSRDEIGQLSEAFNAMAASLREFRRTDQAKLLRIQRATQQAFDSLPDAVAVVDPDGKVEVATESARTIFGLKPGAEVVGPAVRLDGRPLRATPSRTAARPCLEGPAVRSSNSSRARSATSAPKPCPSWTTNAWPTGVILVLKDVTQLRQQDEIKRGVIRTVSHQLKTPLTSIRMAIHLLLEEKVGPLTEKQAELLVAAREDSDRLHDILEQPPRYQPHRIREGPAGLPGRLPAIAGHGRPRALPPDGPGPGRRPSIDDLPGDLPDVWADTTRIGHVFGNLLSNALKHTSARRPDRRCRAAAEETWVRFSVSDTGAGIPAAFLPRVFEPFFRVPGRGNETGAGLGLAIVKEIVEAHGGTVGVESREGRGIDLHLHPAPGRPVPEGEAHDRRALRPDDRLFRPCACTSGLRKALTMATSSGSSSAS